MGSLHPIAAPASLRRSQLHRSHLANKAKFHRQNDAIVVTSYPANTDEIKQAHELGIADLSMLARVGFKGKGTAGWLASQGGCLPQQPNQAQIQPDRSLIVRISLDEYLIISDVAHTSELVNQLENSWSLDTAKRVYWLPRRDSHCCFVLTGRQAETVLSKTCALDMRESSFTNHSVAQTSVARINTIVIRHDGNGLSCFYILSDTSSAEFLWHALLDAMQEFDGKAIGVRAVQHSC